MKNLIILAGLSLSISNANAFFSAEKLKRCHEEFYATGTDAEFRVDCLELFIKKFTKLTEEQKNTFGLIVQDINAGEFPELKEDLIRLAKEYDLNQTDDFDTFQNDPKINALIKDFNSGNEQKMINAFNSLMANYVQLKNVQQVIKRSLYFSNNNTQKDFVYVNIVNTALNSGSNSSDNHQELTKLISYIDLVKLSEIIVQNKNDSENIRSLSYKYLAIKDLGILKSVIKNGAKEDHFLSSILAENLNHSDLRDFAYHLVLEDALKFKVLITPLFIYGTDDQQRVLFSMIEKLRRVTIIEHIIDSAIEHQLARFSKQLLGHATNPSLEQKIRNYILLKTVTIPSLQVDLIDYISKEEVDLNTRKQMLCSLSNGNNDQLFDFLSNTYKNDKVIEELKAYSVSCINGTMNSKFVPIIKDLLKNASEKELIYQSILAIAPFSNASFIADETARIIEKVEKNQEVELLTLLLSRTSTKGNRIVKDVIMNSPKVSATKYIRMVIKNGKSTERIIKEIILTNSNQSISALKELARGSANIELLNDMLNIKDLTVLNSKTTRQYIRTLRRIGNFITVEKILEIEDQLDNIISKEDIQSIKEAIEEKKNYQVTKYTKFLEQLKKLTTGQKMELARLQDLSLLLKSIVNKTWMPQIYVEDYNLSASDIVDAVTAIENKLALNYNDINAATINILYNNLYVLENGPRSPKINRDQTYEKSKYVGSFLFNDETKIDPTIINQDLGDLLGDKLVQSYQDLQNYILLKNIISLSSNRRYASLFTNAVSYNISGHIKTKLISAIEVVSPHHHALAHLSSEEVREILAGKNIFDPNDSELQASNNQENLPSQTIRLKGDITLAPGIYKCPLASDCSIIVNGKFEMDPFALIVGNPMKHNERYYTHDLSIFASSFGNVFVDLSAVNKIAKKPKRAAPGHATTYKQVFSHNQRYCAERWDLWVGSVCVREATRAIYKTVVDVPAYPGKPGYPGIAGNDAGNLSINYFLNNGERNNIFGNISFIAIGAHGGEGGDGGAANGGQRDGLKGKPGRGGNGGYLTSPILLFSNEYDHVFDILSTGGKAGNIGQGTGNDPISIQGSNGGIREVAN